MILVGEVLRIIAAPQGDPLLFFRGEYRRVAPKDPPEPEDEPL